MNNNSIDSYLESIRQQALERIKRRQEFILSEIKDKPKRKKDSYVKPKCKKCERATLDKTGVCWQCKQGSSVKKPIRKVCDKCKKTRVVAPKVLCWHCRLPQTRKKMAEDRIKRKQDSGRCIEKMCHSKAMPNSKTCINH